MALWEEAMNKFKAMAEELGLEDDETESFVNSAMKRNGFKQVTGWADPDNDNDDKGGGDFFSQRRKEAGQTRKVGKQNNGPGWQYGG